MNIARGPLPDPAALLELLDQGGNAWKRSIALLTHNWRQWDAGQPLRNVVDLDAGY